MLCFLRKGQFSPMDNNTCVNDISFFALATRKLQGNSLVNYCNYITSFWFACLHSAITLIYISLALLFNFKFLFIIHISTLLVEQDKRY